MVEGAVARGRPQLGGSIAPDAGRIALLRGAISIAPDAAGAIPMSAGAARASGACAGGASRTGRTRLSSVFGRPGDPARERDGSHHG
jgi:hypothetical protein